MKKAEYQNILNQVKANLESESMQAIRNHVATFESEIEKVKVIDEEYNKKIEKVYEKIDEERKALREANADDQPKHAKVLKELHKKADSIEYGMPLNKSVYESFFNDLKCKCNHNIIKIMFHDTPVLEVKDEKLYISQDIATAFIKYDESTKGEHWLRDNSIRFWYSEYGQYYFFEFYCHNIRNGNDIYRCFLRKDYTLFSIEEYEKNYFLLKEQQERIKQEIEKMNNLVNECEFRNMVNYDSYYRLKNY